MHERMHRTDQARSTGRPLAVPGTGRPQGPRGDLLTPTARLLLQLQERAGNRAVSTVVQRVGALLDSKTDWVDASDLGWTTPRSAKLKAVDTAVGQYEVAANNADRMTALIAILDAIVGWRASKGADAQTGLRGKADTRDRTPFIDSLLVEVKAKVEDLLDQQRAAWDPASGVFSDPTAHDPTKFQYIINAIVDYAAEGNPVPQYINDILDDPGKIRNALVSSSVITETQNPTWATSGFILRVPKENVYAAKGSDQGLQNKAAMWHDAALYHELARVYAANGLPAPAAVMGGMKKHPISQKSHEQNEVAVMGTNPVTGAETTVTGIFVVVAPGTTDPRSPIPLYETIRTEVVNGRPRQVVRRVPGVSPSRMAIYEGIVAKRGIPMVAIPLGSSTSFRSQPGRPTPWDPTTMVLETDATTAPGAAAAQGASTGGDELSAEGETGLRS